MTPFTHYSVQHSDKTACGLKKVRGGKSLASSSYKGDVTCPKCKEVLQLMSSRDADRKDYMPSDNMIGTAKITTKESLLRAYIRESSAMFAGKDLDAHKLTKLSIDLETALMDLDDAGCPQSSEAYMSVSGAIDFLYLDDPEFGPPTRQEVIDVVETAVDSIRICEHINPAVSAEISKHLAAALEEFKN